MISGDRISWSTENASNLDQLLISECLFDKVHRDPYDFQKSAFSLSISPLVKQASEGGSVMAILCSSTTIADSSPHISASNILPGAILLALISQAASQLIHILNTSSQSESSVTFSWFNIDCLGPSEVITDVLKSASASVAAGNNTAGTASGSSLLLRELGKGRGMSVPGLWEVEITGGNGKK